VRAITGRSLDMIEHYAEQANELTEHLGYEKGDPAGRGSGGRAASKS
jgi:hypothetical protein